MNGQARTYMPAELRPGLRAEFEREITEQDILTFAANSGDANPLHVDPEYAGGTRFGGRIAHGAFQIGLASALVGMYLPGTQVLLGSVRVRFPAPLYFPCRVIVGGELTSWNADDLTGTVKVVVRDARTKMPTTEAVMGITLHSSCAATASRAPSPVERPGDKRVLIVTGASGGMGAALVANLSANYFVLALSRQHGLPPELRDNPDVHEIRADLSAPDWQEPIEAALREDGKRLYGIVHAAWPGAPSGGLLGVEDDTIEEQVRFGTLYTIRLARILFAHAEPEGGRFVAVGSLFGGYRPNLSIAAYSLGKTALESTVRLLAPEMARKGIAVNAICPTVLPVGMNKHQSERWYKMKAAIVPLGRLCQPEDVSDMVAFLLSPGAAFLSGQVVELSGGQL
jgi:3-oxoacyl-[acyl-carrier protein] reductase